MVGNPNFGKFGFGSRPREVDDALRAKAAEVKNRPRVWTREKCIVELDFILQHLKKILLEDEKVEMQGKKLKQESIRDLNTMMNRILEFMRYLYPPVQTNVNINVETTADVIMERLKKWKSEQVLIVGDKVEQEIKQESKEEIANE